jgi:hypothetical protein
MLVLVIECETYSRVVGYYRPVQQWNAGKQAEFMNRKFTTLAKPPEESKSNEPKNISSVR